MVIEICTCGHPDTLHVVDPLDDGGQTAKGEGHCYVPTCHCITFTERVRLLQLVSHAMGPAQLLLGLDTLGRVWFWDSGDDVWKRWGDTFQFPIGAIS
jgi:hypothetical protein